jgi:hypothetical protein
MRCLAPGVGFLLLGLAAPAEPGAWTLPGGERWFRVGFMFQETLPSLRSRARNYRHAGICVE